MFYELKNLTNEQKAKLANLLRTYKDYDKVDLLIEMMICVENRE